MATFDPRRDFIFNTRATNNHRTLQEVLTCCYKLVVSVFGYIVLLLLCCSIYYFYWDGVPVEYIFLFDFQKITLPSSMVILSLPVILCSIIFLILAIIEVEVKNGIVEFIFFFIILLSLGIVNYQSKGLRKAIISDANSVNYLVDNYSYGWGVLICFSIFLLLVIKMLSFLESKGIDGIKYLILVPVTIMIISSIFDLIIWDKMPSKYIYNITVDYITLSLVMFLNIVWSLCSFILLLLLCRNATRDWLLKIGGIISSVIILIFSFISSSMLEQHIENNIFFVQNVNIIWSYNIFMGMAISSFLVFFIWYKYILKEVL